MDDGKGIGRFDISLCVKNPRSYISRRLAISQRREVNGLPLPKVTDITRTIEGTPGWPSRLVDMFVLNAFPYPRRYISVPKHSAVTNPRGWYIYYSEEIRVNESANAIRTSNWFGKGSQRRVTHYPPGAYGVIPRRHIRRRNYAIGFSYFD